MDDRYGTDGGSPRAWPLPALTCALPLLLVGLVVALPREMGGWLTVPFYLACLGAVVATQYDGSGVVEDSTRRWAAVGAGGLAGAYWHLASALQEEAVIPVVGVPLLLVSLAVLGSCVVAIHRAALTLAQSVAPPA